MSIRPAQKASYIDLFDRIKDPLLLVDCDFKVIDANPGAEEFFGQSLEDLKNYQIAHLFESPEQMQKEMRVIFRRYHPRTGEKSVIIKDQLKHLQIETCCLELNENGELIKVAQILIKDQTDLINTQQALAVEKQKLEEANKMLAEISITDKLTGLFNRRHFDDCLAKEQERAERGNLTFSLILFDVDKFKHYNDTNGHIPGDKLLTQLAEVIKSSVRQIDIPCRYGGEEFVIICPNTSSEQALILAERIRVAIQNHPFAHREKQPLGFVSVSIGISSFPEHSQDATQLKDMADKALYLSKENGRNQSRIAIK